MSHHAAKSRPLDKQVFHGHQPLLTSTGVVFAVLTVPVIAGLLSGNLEPKFWWWAGATGIGAIIALGYRCRIVFIGPSAVIGKGYWRFFSETHIPLSKAKELTLFAVYSEGGHVFSLWLTLANGQRINLSSVSELRMVHLEGVATRLSETIGIPLRKDDSFYASARDATNRKPQMRRFVVASFAFAGVSTVAALVFRFGAVLGEDSFLRAVAQMYRYSPPGIGPSVEATLWTLAIAFTMISIGNIERLKEPKD